MGRIPFLIEVLLIAYVMNLGVVPNESMLEKGHRRAKIKADRMY